MQDKPKRKNYKKAFLQALEQLKTTVTALAQAERNFGCALPGLNSAQLFHTQLRALEAVFPEEARAQYKQLAHYYEDVGYLGEACSAMTHYMDSLTDPVERSEALFVLARIAAKRDDVNKATEYKADAVRHLESVVSDSVLGVIKLLAGPLQLETAEPALAKPSDGPVPQQGEVWFMNNPMAPDDPHQPRPFLVLSKFPVANRVAVVALSSSNWAKNHKNNVQVCGKGLKPGVAVTSTWSMFGLELFQGQRPIARVGNDTVQKVAQQVQGLINHCI